MLRNIIALVIVTLSSALSQAQISLGLPSVTMATLYETIRNEEGGRDSINSTQLHLDSMIGFPSQSRSEGDDSLEGDFVIDVNLVFEDGEEISGRLAISYVGFEDEENANRSYARAFTLSVERLQGAVAQIVKVHEEEYEKHIVYTDVISAGLRFLENGEPIGMILNGTLGFQRLRAGIGVISHLGSKASTQIKLDLTRELGGFVSDKDKRPNYSLAGLEAQLTYYFARNAQVGFYLRAENIKDYDSSYRENIVSGGVKVRYFPLK